MSNLPFTCIVLIQQFNCELLIYHLIDPETE